MKPHLLPAIPLEMLRRDIRAHNIRSHVELRHAARNIALQHLPQLTRDWLEAMPPRAEPATLYNVATNDSPGPVIVKRDGHTYADATYTAWYGMVKHCYCQKYLRDHPTAHGGSVEYSWLTYTAFLHWTLDHQPADGHLLSCNILKPGSRHYGPDTSRYIHPALHSLLVTRHPALVKRDQHDRTVGAQRVAAALAAGTIPHPPPLMKKAPKPSRANLPVGVYVTNSGFSAHLNSTGVKEYLGTFESMARAQVAHEKALAQAILETAQQHHADSADILEGARLHAVHLTSQHQVTLAELDPPTISTARTIRNVQPRSTGDDILLDLTPSQIFSKPLNIADCSTLIDAGRFRKIGDVFKLCRSHNRTNTTRLALDWINTNAPELADCTQEPATDQAAPAEPTYNVSWGHSGDTIYPKWKQLATRHRLNKIELHPHWMNYSGFLLWTLHNGKEWRRRTLTCSDTSPTPTYGPDTCSYK